MATWARRLLDKLEEISAADTPELDEVYIAHLSRVERLDESRKWVDGSWPKNIGIDDPHAGGQVHAHVFGRKGNEIVIVNLDGTASHGTKGRLTQADADVLKNRGFKIRPDRLVEWFVIGRGRITLFG